jgi:hypothetical protein
MCNSKDLFPPDFAILVGILEVDSWRKSNFHISGCILRCLQYALRGVRSWSKPLHFFSFLFFFNLNFFLTDKCNHKNCTYVSLSHRMFWYTYTLYKFQIRVTVSPHLSFLYGDNIQILVAFWNTHYIIVIYRHPNKLVPPVLFSLHAHWWTFLHLFLLISAASGN